MKALLLSLIVPALAFADGGSTPAEAGHSAEASPVAQTAPAPAAPAATTEEKKDEPKADDKDKKAAAPAQPQQGNAIANAVQARTPEEQAKQSGFQFAFGLDHYIGTGTFVNPEYYASLTAAPSVSATYLFHPGGVTMAASGRVIAYYEYTLPDTQNGRRFFPQDLRFGLSAPSIFKDKALTGIGITPSFGLVIPASPESFTARMITSLSLGLAATRSVNAGAVGSFDFRLTAGLSKGIYLSPVGGISAEQAKAIGSQDDRAAGISGVLCRGGEAMCAAAGTNPNFAVSLGGTMNWRVGGNFVVYAGYIYGHTFKEQVAAVNDPTLPQALDSNGNQVGRGGFGNADSARTYLGVSYQLNEHYNFDIYGYTDQPPLVRVGNTWAPRFPLGSFDNPASNNTSLVVSLGAAY